MSAIVAQSTPPFVERLKEALERQLQDRGIAAEVSYERAGSTKLYRFYVISDDFRELSHTERQSVVWRIAQQELSQPDQVNISMILTLTRDETGSPSS